jgi:hypothetical protein
LPHVRASGPRGVHADQVFADGGVSGDRRDHALGDQDESRRGSNRGPGGSWLRAFVARVRGRQHVSRRR